MIGDYFNDDRKMYKILRFAVNVNIACRLLKVKDSDNAPLEIKKLKFYLHEECGLDEKIASQVVDCFSFALGIHPQTVKSPVRDSTIRKDVVLEQVYDRDVNENFACKKSLAKERKTTHHPAEPEMFFVQGGSFMMCATPEQDNDCRNDEKPAHRVMVDDFFIGKNEVTKEQWEAVMGHNLISNGIIICHY